MNEIIENPILFENVSYDHYSNVVDDADDYTWIHNPFTVILCTLYAIVFVFGLAGNVWVLCNVVKIFKICSFKTKSAFIGGGTSNNAENAKLHGLKVNFTTVIHMFALSVVDVLVLSNVPFLISDLLFNTWVFGFHLCKFYWIVDTVNKVLSIFILTLMSFERYSVVCKFSACNACFRTGKGAVVTLLVVCSVVAVITCPIYLNGTLTHLGRYYESGNETVFVESLKKCTIEIDDETASTYAIILFFVGFCIPSVAITCFYGKILLRLRNHSRSLRSLVSQIPVKKVTCTVLTLVLTYFACWTPFWFVTVYSALSTEFRNAFDYRHVYLVQTTNLLVYVNSALNWIVYAYLNGNFKAIRKSITLNSSTAKLPPSGETSRLLTADSGHFRAKILTMGCVGVADGTASIAIGDEAFL